MCSLCRAAANNKIAAFFVGKKEKTGKKGKNVNG
jgi:hypothetical protein